MTLFVVLLGGTHPNARIEVHDIAFAIGDRLEETYPQLLAQWFGARKGVHIDAWMKVDGVGGFKLTLKDCPTAPDAPKLYFVHLGGYDAGRFGEEHGYELIVANSVPDAKAKAKTRHLASWFKPHTDAVMKVDACMAIERVGDTYLHLTSGAHNPILFENTYLVIG
jgi:hypothetical protein